MRPVRRGVSPISGDFKNYADAKAELVSRLGMYCSFCERQIRTLLAVEHLRPKSKNTALTGDWNNFLLACGNCNPSKGTKDPGLDSYLLPDRDNTFAAFRYEADGTVRANSRLSEKNKGLAEATLSLAGLDKPADEILDANGKRVALDRATQRMEQWGIAIVARDNLRVDSGNQALRWAIAEVARSSGFFSIWMTVFAGDEGMRRRLIDTFPGTLESGCFDAGTGEPVTPAPNPDGLEHGGRV